MFNNRLEYEIARLIRFTCIRNINKIQNLVVLINTHNEYVVIDYKHKREYLKKGYCVIGYFDYLPRITSLELSNIVNEVFNYE